MIFVRFLFRHNIWATCYKPQSKENKLQEYLWTPLYYLLIFRLLQYNVCFCKLNKGHFSHEFERAIKQICCWFPLLLLGMSIFNSTSCPFKFKHTFFFLCESWETRGCQSHYCEQTYALWMCIKYGSLGATVCSLCDFISNVLLAALWNWRCFPKSIRKNYIAIS